jgi:hypothetical protein
MSKLNSLAFCGWLRKSMWNFQLHDFQIVLLCFLWVSHGHHYRSLPFLLLLGFTFLVDCVHISQDRTLHLRLIPYIDAHVLNCRFNSNYTCCFFVSYPHGHPIQRKIHSHWFTSSCLKPFYPIFLNPHVGSLNQPPIMLVIYIPIGVPNPDPLPFIRMSENWLMPGTIDSSTCSS